MPLTAFHIDRSEILFAEQLTARGELTRLTPYWRVGCLAASPAARQIWRVVLPLAKHRQPPVWTVTVLVLGVPPYLGFVAWMLERARDVAAVDLQWRMWVAGLWILLSPGLIVAWERRFLRVHHALLEAARVEGWDRGRLIGVDRIFARLWWPVAGGAGVAILVGYLTGLEFLRRTLGAAGPPDPHFWLGLFITAALGFSFGVGIWGVAKTLVYAWVALDGDLSLDPFRARQSDSFEELSTFAYWTGLLYSMGSIVLPGTLAIIGRLPVAGLVIGIGFAACLVFGGVAVFVLPLLWMNRASGEITASELDRYSRVLNQLSAVALTPPSRDRGTSGVDFSRLADQITALTSLRALVAAEPPSLSAWWVGVRVFAIFVLPILIGALQTATGLG